MMIHKTLSGSAWLEDAELSFLTSKAGVTMHGQALEATAATNSECLVLPFQHLRVEPRKSTTAAFDELEAEVNEASEVIEGRRWVRDQFFGQLPTLAAIRLSAGLSQAELGRRCGMEQPHISRYESGRHEPSISTALALAKGLNISLEDFAAAWAATRAQLD